MKVGLLGFGVVGRGFYDIVATRDDISVAKVVCLEDIRLPDAEVTRDFQSVLADDSIDTIVEAMGGLHPAYEFVRAAMEAGKNADKIISAIPKVSFSMQSCHAKAGKSQGKYRPPSGARPVKTA